MKLTLGTNRAIVLDEAFVLEHYPSLEGLGPNWSTIVIRNPHASSKDLTQIARGRLVLVVDSDSIARKFYLCDEFMRSHNLASNRDAIWPTDAILFEIGPKGTVSDASEVHFTFIETRK